MLPTVRREPDLREAMDDPRCDPAMLRRTYAQFSRVNALLSGWQGVYRTLLRPHLRADTTSTLLDVGCGGGDVSRNLARWARRDGLRLHVTGIDPDGRAIDFARAHPQVPGVTYEQASSEQLVAAGETFDVVISNHVLHHLQPPELQALLGDCERLTRRLAVHSDLRRHPLAYALFGTVARPLFRGSFVIPDGLRSIRRSYTPTELQRAAPDGWEVRTTFPFRNLLLYEHR